MSAPDFTRHTKDVVFFGQLPSAIEQLFSKGIDPPAKDCSNQDLLISSQIPEESQSLLVNVPFPLAVKDVTHYHRSLADTVFSVIKDNPLEYIIHLSRLGAHRPDKTGPIQGCYEMERQLNWLGEPSLLHLRCGFFPEEVLEHIFLLPKEGKMMSLLSPQAPVAVSDPGSISRQLLATLKSPVKAGKFVKQPEPAVFFTIENMLEYLLDTMGEQLDYRQLSLREATQLYMQRGYGPSVAQCWSELFQHLNEDHNLLYDGSSGSGDSASFAELFGKILSEQQMKV